MRPKTLECGRFRTLLSVLVVLFVLSAATAAASHFHLYQQAEDAHCSLCILHATLIAVVVSVALCLSWRPLMFAVEPKAELSGFVVFRIISIRPPPSAQLFR
jgi:uncharacterized membrane protein YidH (DUF202 family)